MIFDVGELARQEKDRRQPPLLERLIAWQSGELILPPEREKLLIAIFDRARARRDALQN